jgi:hypothetical protein
MRATRPMDWAEFEKTVEWVSLSVRQKLWLRTYLESGTNDQLLATNCAYGTTTGESARAFSYKIVKQKKVRAALDRYWNRSLREIFLRDIQADIAAAKPGSLARATFKTTLAQVLAGGKLPKRSKKS